MNLLNEGQFVNWYIISSSIVNTESHFVHLKFNEKISFFRYIFNSFNGYSFEINVSNNILLEKYCEVGDCVLLFKPTKTTFHSGIFNTTKQKLIPIPPKIRTLVKISVDNENTFNI